MNKLFYWISSMLTKKSIKIVKIDKLYYVKMGDNYLDKLMNHWWSINELSFCDHETFDEAKIRLNLYLNKK